MSDLELKLRTSSARTPGCSATGAACSFFALLAVTAAGFAFSHRSNDLANAIGPFAAVLDVLRGGEIHATAPAPAEAMLVFGIALVAGLRLIGKEVIQTVGTHLTRMHPAAGFSAGLSAAAVVLLTSAFGIPVSSTPILVGAVLGTGLANRSTHWALMKPIGTAWVITLPAAAILSSVDFVILRAIFRERCYASMCPRHALPTRADPMLREPGYNRPAGAYEFAVSPYLDGTINQNEEPPYDVHDPA